MEFSEDEFPQESISARAAQAVVEAAMWTDANPMLNLSSFVTTFMEPEARELMAKHAHVNYVDHDMYPKTVPTWNRCMVKWLHELWNGPKDVEPYGAATVRQLGGLHAGRARPQVELAPGAREARARTRARPNMVTGGNVQIVWKKFMKYFDVEVSHRAAEARATTA